MDDSSDSWANVNLTLNHCELLERNKALILHSVLFLLDCSFSSPHVSLKSLVAGEQRNWTWTHNLEDV